MARKATAKNAQANGTGTEQENVSAYFRQVFAEQPELLDSRSNELILDRWLSDHPGVTVIPKRVKNGLMNTKSVLRSKSRRRGRPKRGPGRPAGSTNARTPKGRLNQLEEHIDESLRMARNMEQEGLVDIIQLLRRARNEVVWMMGA
jgi:hypothetical protein